MKCVYVVKMMIGGQNLFNVLACVYEVFTTNKHKKYNLFFI